MNLTHAALFAGIGGTCLAVERAFGARTIWHCEIDQACQEVLERHWPGVPCYGDVTALDFTALERPDILSASYPCQSFSHAGKRKGENDERYLWPEVARAIGDLRPRYVVLENVAGHLTLGFDRVLGDLAALGFDAEWGLVRASDVGAPHRRERLFVLAADRAFTERGGPEPNALAAPAGRTAEPGERSGADSSSSDSRRERHGGGTDGGTLGRVGRADARQARQRERPRAQSVGGGAPSLPTPTARDWKDRSPCDNVDENALLGRVVWGTAKWGQYAPAIARWETVMGPAPSPVDDKGRLNPDLARWMMGFPEGWLHGTRTQQLKQCGNAVVPQQGAVALQWLGERL